MGAGGVGGCLGALLTQAGADITLITRGEHLRAMQEHGLRLNQQTGSFTIPVNATDDPSQVGPVDLVLFAVKTYQVPEAVKAIRPLTGLQTQIVTLQNGVDSAGELVREFGPDRVLPGVSYTIAFIESPGVIRQQSQTARIVFGREDGQMTAQAVAVPAGLAPAVDAEDGLPGVFGSSVAKWFANEMARWVTGMAVQLMGGYGYSTEFPMERRMRDAWGWGIAGGTIDIQKVNIAAAMVGRRFDQRT